MSEAARIDLVDRAPLTEKQQNVYESIMQYQRVNGYDIYAVGNTLRSIRNKYGYTQNDMAESLDVSYIHYSQIEQGRHRMSLELMLKIVTKYGVDPNTLFGIESREKHENKNLSVLEDKLQMLKPNDREYAMSTCLIFIEGLEARKEVV